MDLNTSTRSSGGVGLRRERCFGGSGAGDELRDDKVLGLRRGRVRRVQRKGSWVRKG